MGISHFAFLILLLHFFDLKTQKVTRKKKSPRCTRFAFLLLMKDENAEINTQNAGALVITITRIKNQNKNNIKKITKVRIISN